MSEREGEEGRKREIEIEEKERSNERKNSPKAKNVGGKRMCAGFSLSIWRKDKESNRQTDREA